MASSNINDLLNHTFEYGSLNIKYLEQVIRHIVTKIDIRANELDPVGKLIPNYSKCDDKRMTDIIDMLNITKRIEALEISIQKMSSVMQTMMKTESERPIKAFRSEVDSSSEEELYLGTTSISKMTFSTAESRRSKMDEKYAKLDKRVCDLCCSINQFMTHSRHKMCELEDVVKKHDELIQDLFFSCEQNDEKIYETTENFNNFKDVMTCVKANVHFLMDESVVVKEKLDHLSSRCDDLQETKADLVYVNGTVLAELQQIAEKIKQLNRLERVFDEENENLKKDMIKFSEVVCKFKNDVRQAIYYLDSKAEEKVDQASLKVFKCKLAKQFDVFLDSIRTVLSECTRSEVAKGTTESQKCISCDNSCKTSARIVIPEKAKAKAQKKPEMSILQEELLPAVTKNVFSCTSKPSMLNFPPTTQQCYIITKDNSIFKADLMKCLLSPNYTPNN